MLKSPRLLLLAALIAAAGLGYWAGVSNRMPIVVSAASPKGTESPQVFAKHVMELLRPDLERLEQKRGSETPPSSANVAKQVAELLGPQMLQMAKENRPQPASQLTVAPLRQTKQETSATKIGIESSDTPSALITPSPSSALPPKVRGKKQTPCRNEPYSKEQVALGVGRNVFLDCGACQGDTIEMFFHNGVIPGRKSMTPEFKIAFNYDPSTFKVFAFEANPQHSSALSKLESQFPNLTVFKETALWTENGTLDLFMSSTNDSTDAHQSASLLKGHPDEKGKGSKLVSVPTIDFSRWIYDNIETTDFVLIKMNVEGAEYEVLRKMLNDQTFALLDRMWMFYHSYASPPSFPRNFPQVLESSLSKWCAQIMYQKLQ